ncbi:hypothetical protein VM98_19240 [Streptomyces rubellomurinus subsp. indigoferus]|nr:hypothetical protein VM98_19240 [Streptomyces rubellomurinus subsp. indigoferus]
MGLDDAISKARREQQALDESKRQEEARQQRDQQKLSQLLADAAQRLLPHRGETFHRMRRSPTGTFIGQDRQRYQQVSGHWCWVIKELTTNPTAWNHPVMLLVMEGTTPHAVRVELNLRAAKAGQYVSSLPLTPVGPGDYADRGFTTLFFGGWIDELEKDLGAAIVRYEQGA